MLAAVYAVSQATIAWIIEPLGANRVLQLQLALTPEAFLAVTREWRNAGVLDAYWRHFIFDFPHPVWYGLSLASAIAGALSFARAPASFDGLLLIPFFAGACDLVENAMHVLFLSRPASIVQPWVAISGGFTHVKWLLIGISMLSALLLVARGVAARVSRRMQS